MLQLMTLLASFDNLKFFDNWDAVLKSLEILWQGMLAIFVVIGLIILVVKITGFTINKVTEAKAKRNANKNEQQNS